MTLRQVVNTLKSQGHAVNYRQRNDGSIVITKIDGESFQGKAGNAKARAMLGLTLSAAKIAQLEKIKTPLGKWGHKKEEKVDEDIKRELRRVQAQFRKRGIKEGKPTMRSIRYTIRLYGKKEARERITQASRYARGIAYPQNVAWLAGRMYKDADDLDVGLSAWRLRILADWLMKHRYDDSVKEAQIGDAYEILYQAEQGAAEWADAVNSLEQLFGQ